MIRGFRHKGLARFFETGSKASIQAEHAPRLRLILGRLSAATSARDMGLPGLRLHQLVGDRKGTLGPGPSDVHPLQTRKNHIKDVRLRIGPRRPHFC